MRDTDINPFNKAFEKPAFVSYIVAGDPSPAESIETAKALIDGGADVIELGFPFSDPVGDGPVIQRADTRALDAGFKTGDIFRVAEGIREYSDVPVVIMTYLNPVVTTGTDLFYKTAKESGVNGILIVDMPVEESDIITDAAKRYDLAQIFLISTNTSEERIAGILQASAEINISSGNSGSTITRGFVYLVSSPGVTGARDSLSHDVFSLISKVRQISDELGISMPLAVGFGIARRSQAEDIINAGADGFIVGSAIVKIIEKYSDDINLQRAMIRKFAEEITEFRSLPESPASDAADDSG
ncbi:tryptophan synthase subunit alpha [Methanoplanus endosymbiosus]|uniref:Tryptophan synthase alpha chain n=1 Tax=Methanoplanus endosymbiosus TaxID=33865 RepID=A0A9E7PPA4_9EURY|nr:tryptophan synthase subunit alpha [Methanoplanus endosymbiosus]UUX92574.1 tryptophan synthase subunit alpha [Methanoplanus endosymbiosus]